MYGFKSRRQVNYKPQSGSALFRMQCQRENPNVVGMGLAVHHGTRNGRPSQCLRIQYSIETSIANAVVQNITMFQRLYVPPMLKQG